MNRTLLLALVLAVSGTARADDKVVFRGQPFVEWQGQLQHPDAKMRIRAATALGLGPFGKSAVPALVAALNDENEMVRQGVVNALAELGADAAPAIPALLRYHRNTPDSSVKIEWILARIGPAALSALLDLERSDHQGGFSSDVWVKWIGRP